LSTAAIGLPANFPRQVLFVTTLDLLNLFCLATIAGGVAAIALTVLL